MTMNRRCAVAVAGAVTLVGTLLGAGTGSAQPPTSAAPSEPLISLRRANDVVVAEAYRSKVYVNPGIWLVAGDAGFEARAYRPSYRESIQAEMLTPGGTVTLTDVAMRSFRGLPQFTRVKVSELDGTVVVNRTTRFCPGYERVRVRQDAPDTPTYPSGCWYRHPYTLGAVYGVDPGWAVPLVGEYGGIRMKLPLGRYDVSVRITDAYREVLGLDPNEGIAQVRLRVVKGEEHDYFAKPNRATTASESEAALEPVLGTAPRGPSRVPGAEARPDLRSLPAFAIQLNRRGFLQFAATVWNAGPSPLVIDGFRRDGEDVMDAYQYFYDADMQQVGHEEVGTMIWHNAEQHHHWHFTDFARYRLLDADEVGVVRSRKESFCLANTDAVDYTVEGANWHPEGTDLHTACGDFSSIGVREVLDSGSGDTYYQWLPGQSFNVKHLPNGTYFIAVEANPVGNLSEVSTANNISYRKVILKGSGDNRRVVVPKIGIIDER
ncbi:MAG: lysyl oxidase family protein [Nocardioidaceae bacterium]